jgi:SAM-dependent methyltransferase
VSGAAEAGAPADAIADAYATLFEGLTQLGPATDATRLAVLERVRGRLPAAPVVADMGCGAGPASLLLARELPGARITAIDTHQRFLAVLAAAAAASGAAITTLEADMAAAPLAAGTLDLLWCDSAIYAIGRGVALRAWRPLLKPSGFLVFSDVAWATDAPPEAARAFWADEYPAMATTAAIAAEIAAAGYAVVASHAAPGSDWRAYYAPLRRRLDALRPSATGALAEVLDGFAKEIAVFDGYGDSYASVYFVATPGPA